MQSSGVIKTDSVKSQIQRALMNSVINVTAESTPNVHRDMTQTPSTSLCVFYICNMAFTSCSLRVP